MHRAIMVGAWVVGMSLGGGARAHEEVPAPGSALVVDGHIWRVDLGRVGDTTDDASTVATIAFEVHTGGLHLLDILSWEVVFDHHGVGEALDLNGDGLHEFFDTEILLFRDDGSLDASDLVDSNGDSEFPDVHDDGAGTSRHNGGGNEDGSVFEFDSFMRVRLSPGAYLLKVGAATLGVGDAIDGLNDTSPINSGLYPARWDGTLGEIVAAERGAFRATIRLVPAPGACGLAAWAAIAGGRRGRRPG